MRASCRICALLAPMAWVHATTVGLSQSLGILAFFAIRCELAADDWSAHVQCLGVEQAVWLAYWVDCVDRFTHSSAATVPVAP